MMLCVCDHYNYIIPSIGYWPLMAAACQTFHHASRINLIQQPVHTLEWVQNSRTTREVTCTAVIHFVGAHNISTGSPLHVERIDRKHDYLCFTYQNWHIEIYLLMLRTLNIWLTFFATVMSWLGIETQVLKYLAPGETQTFCQTWNPVLGSPQNLQVSGLHFCTKSAAFNGVLYHIR